MKAGARRGQALLQHLGELKSFKGYQLAAAVGGAQGASTLE